MKVLCVFGRNNYGDARRGESYEYANFVPALRRLGHEVLFLDSLDRSARSGFPELNEALLSIVDHDRPDVILSALMLYEIWLETWEILRDSAMVATVNWATDDSWKYRQFSRLLAPAFHAFATTYPEVVPMYHRDGIRHVLLTQWAANGGALEAPLPASECRYPVSFVGTAYGERSAWVRALERRGIDVITFGHGWPRGPVAAHEIPAIIRQSVISLNFANSVLTWKGPVPQKKNQIKARTFEVPGAGGFLLTQWADGLDRYYTPGREVAVFREMDELADAIRYYLAHPAERDALARAGFRRTCEEHTYDRRLPEVLDFAVRHCEEHAARTSASCRGRLDWDRFRSGVSRHRMDWKLRCLRRVLTSACGLVWGPVRGPRAARRLVFELSWRLAGARTYAAGGVPGRMFYAES
jgi:spore maturation protein CgeB